MIRSVNNNDAVAIANIYNHYVSYTDVTFEVNTVVPEEITQRISEVTGVGLPWIVFEDKERVLGYAYASKWHKRCAYRHCVESSVYVDQEHTSRGIGTQLYRELLDQLRASKLHVVVGGISLPNSGSIALHERFGFKKVAHFQEIGFKFNRWIDVGYWQLNL